MKSALILYPNQLFPLENLPDVDTVLMVEDPLFFGLDQEQLSRPHKQKIILHRASMQRYIEEVLWPAGMKVEYLALDAVMTTEDVFSRAKKFEQLYLFDPIDENITHRLLQARREDPSVAAFEFLASPNFYLKNHEIQSYFAGKTKHDFDDFYQWQRERFNILIGDDYKPVGGTWKIEPNKKSKLSEESKLPSFEVFGNNKYVDEAVKYTEEHFSDNFGSSEFIWPTNHKEAEKWLNDFVETRLDNYSSNEESIHTTAPWLYHSALSSSLNTGLLSPMQVVNAALERHKKNPVDLANLEGFIRQVLGTREFVRAQYISVSTATRKLNYFGHKRKMTTDWLQGSLGLPPYDGLIKKVHNHGYAFSVEKSVIAGNLMLISEIDPVQINHWFKDLFVDAYDWIVGPNVYNMIQFLEDTTSEKTCLQPSDYILSISNYDKGDWCDVWDGLFWRFVEQNHEKLKPHKYATSLMKKLNQLDADHRRIIGYRAEDFLAKFTR